MRNLRYKTVQQLLLIIGVVLVSCEKDLDIDYHTTEPLYVVEASTTPAHTVVRITQTVDVSEVVRPKPVDGALVVVTDGDGRRDTARMQYSGNYISSMGGTPGTTYRIDINVGGQLFSSTSVMQRQPVLNSFRLVWQDMMSTRVLFGELRIADYPGEENYYYIHVFRNDYGYRWTVFRDTGNPGQELKQLFGVCSEDEIDSEDNPGATDIICEGDRMRVEIRAVDRRAYDYLSSMQTMDSAGSNPIANFTNGCLGYYSAYNPVVYEFVFHRADVVEADDESSL